MRRRAPKRAPAHTTRSGLVIVAFYHKSGPFRVMGNRIEVRTDDEIRAAGIAAVEEVTR